MVLKPEDITQLDANASPLNIGTTPVVRHHTVVETHDVTKRVTIRGPDGTTRHCLADELEHLDRGTLGDHLDEFESLEKFWDGSIITANTDIDVIESGGNVFLTIEKEGGGDVVCRFDGKSFVLDTTPLLQVQLTAGTDEAPLLNFIFITEAGGVLTLNASTSFPFNTRLCGVAIVTVQTAASVAIDGVMVFSSAVNEINEDTLNGHQAHVSAKLRALPADYQAGVDPSDLVIVSPDAFISTTVGIVAQLRSRVFPAFDMQTGSPVFVVNDFTTPFLRITSLDDLTTDANGGSIDGRHFNIVLWGAIAEDTGDCKLFLSLPLGTYNNEGQATEDANGFTVYEFPAGFGFLNTGFLIAQYRVVGRDSGAWIQNAKIDLRGITGITAGVGSVDISGAVTLVPAIDARNAVIPDGDVIDLQKGTDAAVTVRTADFDRSTLFDGAIVHRTTAAGKVIGTGIDASGQLGTNFAIAGISDLASVVNVELLRQFVDYIGTRRQYAFFDHFTTRPILGGWVENTGLGGGSWLGNSTNDAQDLDHPGIAVIDGGATVGGFMHLYRHNDSVLLGNDWSYEALLAHTAAISSGTTIWRWGWLDAAGDGLPTDGLYFETDISVSTNIFLVVATGGTIVKTDSLVALTFSGFHRWTIALISGIAVFFVDGAQLGIVFDQPSAIGEDTGPQYYVRTGVLNGNARFLVDWIHTLQPTPGTP